MLKPSLTIYLLVYAIWEMEQMSFSQTTQNFVRSSFIFPPRVDSFSVAAFIFSDRNEGSINRDTMASTSVPMRSV